MAETANNQQYQVGTGATFFYSLLFHAIIILLGIFGLPHIKKEFHAPQPISIEIATIDDIIKTTEPPKEQPKPEPKNEKPVETPPKADRQPTVNTEKTPKEIKKEEPKKEETKTVKPPKEAPTKKPEIKKPEQKKEEPKKEEAKEEVTEDAFASILKNLSPEEEQSQPKTSQQGQVSQTITADELSAVRQQLTNCWNLLPGARDADKLSVELRIQVFPDRTLKSVDIVDKSRYQTDPFFRAAADNAVRAVRNPSCSPLNLPPNKYDLWKDIIFNFDPRGMF